jgi:anthranilate phosphoribosyltransferase
VVVKHGNRAITSQCGGADVLEALGVRIDLPPAALRDCVMRHGLGFVFAPGYHPAFKAIVPVRKALAAQGTATVFNILGPLLNPARPAYQLTGIFDRTLLRKYGEVFALLGRRRAWAIHGDGADEIALWGATDVVEAHGDRPLREWKIDPDGLGCARCRLTDLRGGDRMQNAAILQAVLDGTERGPRRDIVALNAAAGFVITGLAPDLSSGVALACEQLDRGAALAKLRALQSFNAEQSQ